LKALVKSIFRRFGLDVVRHRQVSSEALESVQAFIMAADLRPGALCFDVGANTGQTIDALLENPAQAQIHAFEPSEEPFAELQAKYGSNPRVRLVKSGVSSRSGTETIYVNSSSKLNSLHKTNETSDFKQGQVVGEETIELITLDAYCQDQDIDFIDVLKIDVQGHEPEVLEGAQKLVQSGRIEWVIAEIQFGDFYDTKGNDLRRVIDLLDGTYRVFAIIDATYIGKIGAISHADFIFRRVEGQAARVPCDGR
jgi:FkbM family methyltransferase